MIMVDRFELKSSGNAPKLTKEQLKAIEEAIADLEDPNGEFQAEMRRIRQIEAETYYECMNLPVGGFGY